MTVTELTPVPDAALPVEAFRAHLRLGTGFGEDTLQDEVLRAYLRASLAAIEARLGKMLLARDFEWELYAFPEADRLRLSVAPVTEVLSFALRDREGAETVVDLADYVLRKDRHAPSLMSLDGGWPTIASGGAALLRLTAGHAQDWDALPADLAQAVFLLAAHFYEFRNDTGLHAGCMPFGVSSLIDRHRMPRITLGAMS